MAIQNTKPKNVNAKFAKTGVINTTKASMVGVANSMPGSSIIAEGNNIIIGYDLPGSKGINYFCLKNVGLKDFIINISPPDMPQGTLDFNFFDSESKSFDIPDHIPKEQHTKYIKEQFDLD